MKKMRFLFAAALSLAVALSAAACAKDPTQQTPGGNGSAAGDTYQDYSPDKQPGDDPFDFDGNYETPELTIDGLGNDEQWQGVGTLLTYGKQIDGSDAVSVKVYRGEKALFFLFEVSDPVLLTQGVTNDDMVTHGDSIELFLDTLADGGANPQSDDYQLNLGIHGKTRIMQGAGGLWGNWNGLIDYEVALNGTLNNGVAADDLGYSVEVMVPYAQIQIEKDDTIGIAFGQVDKVRTEDAMVGSETGPWNWYGWSYNESAVNPQVPNQYILLSADNVLMSRDEQPKPPADIVGAVLDADGSPIEGAWATAVWNDVTKTATTDASGYFTIADVDSEGTYTVTVEKAGYLAGMATYTRAELRAADGGKVLKEFRLVAMADLETTAVTGTVRNIAYGAVEGATVSVQGTAISATSGAGGAFTLEGVPANNGDVVLVVSKEGYADTQTLVGAEDLEVNGTTAIGDVNLNLPYADGGSFATGAGKVGANIDLFANIGVQISRTLDGIEFRFDGERYLHGKIELFIDTDRSVDPRESDPSAWRIDLYEDKIEGTHFAGGAFTSEGLDWQVLENTSENGFRAVLLIPYEYLSVEPLEVIGLSFGQWSTAANGNRGDWDGWAYNGTFVAPENPTGYLRFGALNNFYVANNNDKTAAFSGSTGVAGITVTANGVSTVSGVGGAWSMTVPVDSEAITVTYTGRGYVTKQTVIRAGYFSGLTDTWSETVIMEEQKVTIGGTVTDQLGEEVEGVMVTLTYAGGGTVTDTTDSVGEYRLENVTAFEDVTITFVKDGYAQGTESMAAAQLAGATSHTVNKSIVAESAVQNVTLSGKVIGVNGAIEGVTVTAGDLSATTGEDGTFTLENFPVVDAEIEFAKDGYLGGALSFRAADHADAQGTVALEQDVFLALDYKALGGAFGTKEGSFASFVPYVTRGENAFLFRFEGSAAFTGWVEMFADTGLSAGKDGRNSTDYRFNLYADGTVTVDNFGGGNTGINTLRYTVSGAESDSPVLNFEVPYAFFGVERDEIIGVTFGQSANSDWDGWNAEDLLGFNGEAYVQPECPWDYIRIGVDNTPFWSLENVSPDVLDLASYNLHFGAGLDNIHAKVSRTAEGTTFEFVTLGDFGYHDGTNTDYVLMYFDKGEPAAGWGVDYLIKIDKDGNVYGKNEAWWLAGEENKIGSITIDRQNGITKFSYTVANDRIGVEADEVFGFTLVQGWLAYGNNAALSYGGCLYQYANGSYVVKDAADTAGYIRVKADGTLVVAQSNAAVTE